MPRKLTGTVRILLNADGELQWHGKWTRLDKTRSDWLPLPEPIALDDVEAAKACAASMAPEIRIASEGRVGSEPVEKYAGRWLNDRQGA